MTSFASKHPWYKERWPWILMAGPAIVVVAGVVTAWLAIVSNDGLVSDDYYKEGLAVNQQLLRNKGAAQMGLVADFMRSDQKLRLVLSGQQGHLDLPAEVTLKFAHPTQAGLDQVVHMVSQGAGFYAGNLSSSIAGRWNISLEDPMGQWRLQGEWKVDSGEPLRLAAKMGS